MANSAPGIGPKPLVHQGDNSVDKERESPKPTEFVRYTSQVSEDEGYRSDSSVKNIIDRKVTATPGKPCKRVLEDFDSVCGKVRMKLRTACKKQKILIDSMPKWYQLHFKGDDRYPVAFARALQHLAPDAVNGLTEEVTVNLAEVEAHLSRYGKFGEGSTLQAISPRDLIELIEAGTTYHVLLGNTEAAQQLADIWGKYHSDQGKVVFALQDARTDITRNLGLPARPGQQ
ncbi:hypothetical protein J7438_17805 [Thalassotalea sp. G20_0]|uniref:hypothetical protein n=1 Tax=Thalassotalea sp. G20_0 TaxID=2821093 RepID=UPI001ADD388D|nr:hypothetical protein [Thalassotalea sp. G20_0]MBO9495923.1 hypothetical protein [Thalassotalea sp. G20_0]